MMMKLLLILPIVKMHTKIKILVLNSKFLYCLDIISKSVFQVTLEFYEYYIHQVMGLNFIHF